MQNKINLILQQWNILPLADLREKFQEEEKRVQDGKQATSKHSKEYTLEELVQALDTKPAPNNERMNLDELIRRIDAKIAELEREEAQMKQGNSKGSSQAVSFPGFGSTEVQKEGLSASPEEWLKELRPRSGFRVKYVCAYLRAFIKQLADAKGVLDIDLFTLIYPDINLLYVGEAIRNIIKEIFSGDEDARIKYIALAKDGISSALRTFAKKTKYSGEDLELLRFYRDLLLMVFSFSKPSREYSMKRNAAQTRSFICFCLARGLYFKKPSAPAEGLGFAKQGLLLADPEDRCHAFIILGFCATDTVGCRQLAYDTCYAWANRDPELLPREHGIPVEESCFDETEKRWRESAEGKKQGGRLFANYAYICAMIADSYELNSKRWRVFSNLAVEQIERAIEQETRINIELARLPIETENFQIISDLEQQIHQSNKRLASYYCTYGTLLSEQTMPNEDFLPVIEKYEMYKHYAFISNDREDRLTALRSLFESHLENALSQLLRWRRRNGEDKKFSDWIHAAKEASIHQDLRRSAQEYRELLEASYSELTGSDSTTHKEWKEVLDTLLSLQDMDKDFLYRLLIIHKLSKEMMHFLKRREYNGKHYFTRNPEHDENTPPNRENIRTIAYYTTLKTAGYLFDTMYRDDNHTAPRTVKPSEKIAFREGLNCLTMMNARYMNDDYEGKTFADCVSGTENNSNILFYQGDSARFREDIYDKYFVFLKSFTDKTDDLLMWNRYGSDRYAGSRDSNGCFVQFNTDFFDKVNDSDIRKELNLLDASDDYALYQVVYVTRKEKQLSNKKQKLSPYVKKDYALLIKLLREINQDLGTCTQEQIKAVRSYVQMSLQELLFLFKYDDYADEAEFRLIATRSCEQLDNIRLIPGEPNLLCVNPYFQVCIDKVILGPNVEKPDYWLNHFRYHIAAMWRRALGPGKPIPEFTVEKSNIHYHT